MKRNKTEMGQTNEFHPSGQTASFVASGLVLRFWFFVPSERLTSTLQQRKNVDCVIFAWCTQHLGEDPKVLGKHLKFLRCQMLTSQALQLGASESRVAQKL